MKCFLAQWKWDFLSGKQLWGINKIRDFLEPTAGGQVADSDSAEPMGLGWPYPNKQPKRDPTGNQGAGGYQPGRPSSTFGFCH